MQRLTIPVLVLVGTQDALRNGAKIIARLEPLLPRLTGRIIPGAGHALMETTQYIVPFLAEQLEPVEAE